MADQGHLSTGRVMKLPLGIFASENLASLARGEGAGELPLSSG
jgi:hypothetical protein